MTGRKFAVLASACTVIACSSGGTEVVSLTPPESFTGAWRSITPPVEFVRFVANLTSSQYGAVTARLTFSGVAWEGPGRVESDSLVAEMSIAGSTAPGGVLVARVGRGETLTVVLRHVAAEPFSLRFVRDQ